MTAGQHLVVHGWAGRVSSRAVYRPLPKVLGSSSHAVLLHEHLVLLLLQHEGCKLLLLLLLGVVGNIPSHTAGPRSILHKTVYNGKSFGIVIMEKL